MLDSQGQDLCSDKKTDSETKADAAVESQDNRKVSCLMAAYRKGNPKVMKWVVEHVRSPPTWS